MMYFQRIRRGDFHMRMKRGGHVGAFTFLEVMISTAIFVTAMAGVFLAYGQGIRMLDGLRQYSRAEDIAMANVEFLRTRNWTVLTNVITTSSSSTISQNSSNMTESTSTIVVSGVTNSPVCTHLVLLSSDPLRIGIKGIQRDLVITPSPITATTDMIQATVIVSWDKWGMTGAGQRLTNSMTTYIAKGGLSADVF